MDMLREEIYNEEEYYQSDSFLENGSLNCLTETSEDHTNQFDHCDFLRH